jgi:ABC-2 type transport system permease protein
MWLLSGAFFPLAGAPVWLRALMRANPMTYGVAALRGVLYAGRPGGVTAGLPGPAAAAAVTALLALAGFAFDLAVTRGGRVE